MAKSPEQQALDMIANLPRTTGKSIEQWLALVTKSKLTKHGEIVAHLKSEHGIGHGYANLIAHKALKSDASEANPDELIAAQYAGPKAALKPIYDAVLAVVTGFGADVEVAPKKAYVSLRRSKQFAMVGPGSASRVDLGINLKGREPTGRLEAARSASMSSHCVRLTSPKEVDAEVKKWLKEAYDKA